MDDSDSSAHASGARSRCGASASAASRCDERISGACASSDARSHAASEKLPKAMRQAGLAAQVVRQAVDCTEQAVPDAVDVERIAAHDRHEIAVAQFEQLDEPVFDLDVAMGARRAQTRGVGERLSAVIVEAAQIRGEVAMSHGGERLKMRRVEAVRER